MARNKVHSRPSGLRALLLDVGGTLWPDQLSANAQAKAHIRAELAKLLPDVDAAALLQLLRAALATDDDGLSQHTHAHIQHALARGDRLVDAIAIRRALCVPAALGIQLFPGARELLATSKALGLKTVIVSNVQVRGVDEYWRDFRDLGVSDYIDAIVTSLEVGFRKPHPAMFLAALNAAGCRPNQCVMIGDSEVKDIEPANALGIYTIRVAIEQSELAPSAAHAIANDLHEVADLITPWVTGATQRAMMTTVATAR